MSLTLNNTDEIYKQFRKNKSIYIDPHYLLTIYFQRWEIDLEIILWGSKNISPSSKNSQIFMRSLLRLHNSALSSLLKFDQCLWELWLIFLFKFGSKPKVSSRHGCPVASCQILMPIVCRGKAFQCKSLCFLFTLGPDFSNV